MRAIVTVTGADRPGIIAGVSAVLYAANVNILDVSQTVLRGEVFVMSMLADLNNASCSFEELTQKLEECGRELRMDIRLQRQEIFDAMYKV